MSIRALIEFSYLNAEGDWRQPALDGISWQALSSDISWQKLVADGGVLWVRIAGETTYRRISASNISTLKEVELIADVFALADQITLSFSRSAGDGVGMVDHASKAFSTGRQDSVSASDVASKSPSKAALETVNIADLSTNSITKVPTEQVLFADQSSWSLSAGRADSLVFSEITTKSIDAARSDSLSVNDTFSREVVYQRAFSDAFTVQDQFKIDDYSFSNFANLSTLSDQLALLMQRTVEESVALAEVSEWQLIKPLDDTTVLAEEASLQYGLIRGDTASVTDEINVVLITGLSRTSQFNGVMFNDVGFNG